MTPTDPRELLRAYSEQRVTDTQVMRGLAEHNGWYVPAGFALDQLQTNLSEHAIIFSTEFNAQPARLLLFSDQEAAHRADGQPIGLFTSAFSGARIFSALDERYISVSVNLGSPQAESWYIDREAFPMTRMWGQAVELERLLKTDYGSRETFAKVAAHPGFMLMINPSNQPIDVGFPGVEGKFAIAFTAPDLSEAFLSSRPEAERQRLHPAAISGLSMFQQLQNFPMAGVILNIGDDMRVVPRQDFETICAAAA